MKFDAVLFKETFFEMLGSLSPLLFIIVSINLAMLIVSVFRKILEPPASRIYPNIEEDDDDREFEDRYNYEYPVDSVLDKNSDPIKSMKRW